jgi:hypothetical protein
LSPNLVLHLLRHLQNLLKVVGQGCLQACRAHRHALIIVNPLVRLVHDLSNQLFYHILEAHNPHSFPRIG